MAVTDYLKGFGTVNSPYVIHSLAAAVQFFGTDIYTSGIVATLIVDIDISAYTFDADIYTKATLYGNGRKITGLKHFKNNEQNATFYEVKFISLSWLNYYGQQGSKNIKFQDVSFESCTLSVYNGPMTFTRCMFINVKWVFSYVSSTTFVVTNSFIFLSTNKTNPGEKFTDLSSSSDPYDTSLFTSLSSSIWVVDGASVPRLIAKVIASLSQVYAVKGITKIGGKAKTRRCRAHSTADFNEIANVVSANDGSYLLNCGYYNDQIYVTHSDDYGSKLIAGKSYVLGEYIHSTIPNGYRYKCTTAGISAAILPSEPWSTSANFITGTAIFIPEPLYKTETFLVVPQLYNLLTGQPV